MTQEQIYLSNAVHQHGEEMRRRFEALDLAIIGGKMQDERINAIYTGVLNEIPFYAGPLANEEHRWANEPRQGERVTDYEWAFLLKDEDFAQLLKIGGERLTAAGITNENGTYIERWYEMQVEARRAALTFAIRHFVPDTMTLDEKLNYTQGRRFTDAVRKLVGAPAEA